MRPVPVIGLVAILLAPRFVGAQDAPFVRGDVNQDRVFDVSDPIGTLRHLFAGGALTCESAADFDDDGALGLTDAIAELDFLFRAGATPPSPYPDCGPDATPDGLTCAQAGCADTNAVRVIISEVMASNDTALLDEDGDSSDWLELQRLDGGDPGPVSLGGWYLTDDPSLQDLWRIPDGIELDVGGLLLIFASGKDRAVAGEELHAAFRFDAGGDYLALLAEDGTTIVDEISPLPPQLSDISYGVAQTRTTVVEPGANARYLVPSATDAALAASWMRTETDDRSWARGLTGLGFSSTSAEGFSVTTIRSSVPVDSLEVAEAVLADPGLQVEVATGTAEVIDFFHGGDGGNFAVDQPLPGIATEETEDVVVHVTGTILIPATGSWTFGVFADDGYGLVLDNGVDRFTMSHADASEPGDELLVMNFTRAGACEVDLVYFQRSGGAGLELFAARGSRVFFTTAFRLVGDESGAISLLDFASAIRTDLSATMKGVNASVWARLPFFLDGSEGISALTLRMQYEDGFVAYLNGEEVARAHAPAALPWNAAATADRALGDIGVTEEFDISSRVDLLRPDANVLAIHGLNDSAADANFVLVPELVVGRSNGARQYMTEPTPGAINIPGAAGYVRDVTFSAVRGYYDAPFSLALSTTTPLATIRYTLDGTAPTATTGEVYSGPFAIQGTSTVRAAAFRTGYLDSNVVTHTYFFTSDIIRQSPTGQRPGPLWPAGAVNGQAINYGMDPDVVNDARWSGEIEDALRSIPSVSLVTDLKNFFDASTGIYVNAQRDGRAWERPTSVEFIHSDGTTDVALDAGVRIRGAFSRNSRNPKHSLRLFFRREYGEGKLRYPLFGGEGTDEFDKIDLRTSQNYSWASEGSAQNTFMREVFSRDTQRDMGVPYTRSRYYHLFLNGHYWGLYQTQERVDASFAESYLGGDAEDYDVIKNNSSGSRAIEASDGTIDAYRRLYDAARAGFASDAAYFAIQGLGPDGQPDPNRERLLDPANLMDYMACTYYVGDPDSPISAWAHFSNNIFAVYDRTRRQGFRWFRHDAEHSLGSNGGLNEARLLTDPTDRSIGQDWDDFNPAWLHLRLTQNLEYRLAFADRVSEHFREGGLLASDANLARWNHRAAQIESAVICASARWGDSARATPRTQIDWLGEVNGMRTNYFPRRTAIVLQQMRQVDMFPDAGIVTLSRHGGDVAAGFELTLGQGNGQAGTIWWTEDGSDPRLRGGGVAPTAHEYAAGTPIAITQSTTIRARVRTASEWGALTDARFTVGLDGLVINEIMASNSVTIEDPDEPGEHPDWIELYNPTASAIDLGGMYITDDATEPTHWQIGAGVTIPAGGYLIIWADDDGTQGPTHTNFQLSQNGETILLVDRDGRTILDAIVFDVQERDVSWGRFPDGDEWGFLRTPSPGAPNGPHAP